jgi:hypothetical protein
MGAILIPLLGLAASAIGTGVQAWQNSKANELAENNYNKTRASLLSYMYANPLDSVTNKALLSQMDRRLEKREKAIENQAASGGATFENTLAAKQASNEAMADVISGMLVGEQARQDQFRNQLLNLDSQRTAQQIAQKQQSGAMWSKLGDNIFNATTNLGGSMIESGTGVKDLFNFKA